jgi:curli biogenesis system outer membrane secretion channel CsgG
MPKKIWLVALSVMVAAAVLAAAPARAQEESSERVAVAVMDFTTGAVPWDLRDDNIGRICANTLTVLLQRNPYFEVAERARIETVTNEIRLGASGLVDSDKAAEIGKLLAVKYLVYGDVQSIEIGKGLASAVSSVIGGGILGGRVRVKGTHCRTHVNYKMVEVETGKVVLSRTFKEIKDVTHVVDGPEARLKLVNETLSKTAERMARAMMPKVEAVVAAINAEEGTLVITVGSQHGVVEGAMFRVYRKGNEVKNPATGEVIDVQITELAKALCTDVREKASTLQVGDYVKAKRSNKREWKVLKEKLAEIKVGDLVGALEAE